MAREFFNAYHSYLKAIETLTEAEIGRLFVACLNYSMSGAAQELRGNERHVFPLIRSQIDRDVEKYEQRCDQNRQNILRRYTGDYDRIRKGTKPTKEKEKEKEKTKEKEHSADVSAFFERIWLSYPNKRGKGKVTDAQKAKLFAIGEEELSRCVSRYLSELEKDEWRKPQNGSTFFTSGFVDYLDRNFVEEAAEPVKPRKTLRIVKDENGEEYMTYDD